MGSNNPRERKAKNTGTNPVVSPSVSSQSNLDVSRATFNEAMSNDSLFGDQVVSTDVDSVVSVSEDGKPSNEDLERLKASLNSGAFAVTTSDRKEPEIEEQSAEDEFGQLEVLSEKPPSERQLKRQAKAHEAAKRAKGTKLAKNIVAGISVTFAVIIVVIVISFCIFRWQTFDDAADMQGKWYYKNSETSIEITQDKIVLTSDVAYSYVIDPEAKTIQYTFGYMSGEGRYRFSLDRSQLAISDGQYEFWGTFIDDAIWTVRSLFTEWFSLTPIPISENANSIILVRDITDLNKIVTPVDSQSDDSSNQSQMNPGTKDSSVDTSQAADDESDSQNGSDDSDQNEGSSSAATQTPGTGLDLPVNDLPNTE